MDFWGTILVLFRRWYIALPAFVLAFVATGAVYVSRPLLYASTSVLVLTTPTSGAIQRAHPTQAPDLTNPLLNFDQGLSNAAAILVQALSAPETSDRLGVLPGGDPTYQVSNGGNNPELLINGPLVVITAQSASPGKAQDLAVRVAQQAQQELVSQQRKLKAPPSTYIVLTEAVAPTSPQPQRKTRLRPAISVLALGGIASVAAVFGVESIMRRPGRRRHDDSAPARRPTAGTIVDLAEAGGVESGRRSVTARHPSGVVGLDDGQEG